MGVGLKRYSTFETLNTVRRLTEEVSPKPQLVGFDYPAFGFQFIRC